jgi:hypothetical protein
MFVWQLMTNEHTTETHWVRGIQDWSPFLPTEPTANTYDERGGRAWKEGWQDDFQVLEEERLGSVLLKAWKSEYESAEQVAKDVRRIAENVGIKVVGDDEVNIGEKWEDVFEIVKDLAWKWGPSMKFKADENDKEKEEE